MSTFIHTSASTHPVNMTTNQSHLLGAPGKDPLVPGTSSTQSPPMDNPILGCHVTPNEVNAVNALISTVVLNNSHVKKLNAFHRLHRSYLREAALRCPSINNPCPDMGPDPN